MYLINESLENYIPNIKERNSEYLTKIASKFKEYEEKFKIQQDIIASIQEQIISFLFHFPFLQIHFLLFCGIYPLSYLSLHAGDLQDISHGQESGDTGNNLSLDIVLGGIKS